MSSNEYPEHLNPFTETPQKKSLGFRESFRRFTKPLRRSFRRKPREEVTIRVKKPFQETPPHPVSLPNTLTPALPRSRFHERLTKTYEHSDSECNPFETESEAGTIRRKAKKRAPLPPKSRSSLNINGDSDRTAHNSNWSLTSVETDYSTEQNEPENDESTALTAQFSDFAKEMQKLNDETNNNIIEESPEIHGEIPDLVITCPNNDSKAKPTIDENLNKDSEGEEPQKEPPEDEQPNKTIPESEDEHSDDQLIVRDITSNLIEDKSPYLYNERTSLYLAGSTDQLNDSNKCATISMYVKGSKEELDVSNNNEVCDNETIQEAITPKQRKHRLTKTALLGAD